MKASLPFAGSERRTFQNAKNSLCKETQQTSAGLTEINEVFMRRPPSNFKVEVRRSTRRTSRVNTFDPSPEYDGSEQHDILDAPGLDDVPSRDVHQDIFAYLDDAQQQKKSFEEEMHEAEALLFGRPEPRPQRQQFTAITPAPRKTEHTLESVFGVPSPSERHIETPRIEARPPLGSRPIFQPTVSTATATPMTETTVQAGPPRTGRILESIAYVDPLAQRLAEIPERRRGRPRKVKALSPAESTARIAVKRQPKAQPADLWPDDIAVSKRTKTAPISTISAPPMMVDRVTKASPRVDQRILYNAWTYKVVKASAQRHDVDAGSVLRPGERWKRRLPASAW